MRGVTLIGMPGAGKSTIGKKLAKKIDFDFVDLDLLIKEKEGKSHVQLIRQKGEKEFKRLEEKHALEVRLANTIFSPGGSIVYSALVMERLSNESKIIYLEVPLKEIEQRLGAKAVSRGIIGLKEKGLRRLYRERTPLYQKYAHHIINCSGFSDEEVVSRCLDLLG